MISNIGHLTQHLKRIVENPDDEVHIGGDYKAIAPQSLIKKHKKEFKFFIAELSEKNSELFIIFMQPQPINNFNYRNGRSCAGAVLSAWYSCSSASRWFGRCCPPFLQHG